MMGPSPSFSGNSALATHQPAQLTLDGGEVTHPPSRHRSPLSEGDLIVLALLGQGAEVGTAEAGVEIHRLHGCVPEGRRWDSWTGDRSLGCCPYASSAGYRALKRLEQNGLAAQGTNRHWTVQ